MIPAIPRRALGHPRLALLLGVGLTLVAASGLLFLRVDADGRALIPSGDPAVLFDRELRERFDAEDLIAVVLVSERSDGICNESSLARIRQLHSGLETIPGLDPREIVSLASEKSRWRGAGNALDFRTFLDPLPKTAADIDQLRGDLRAMPVYAGTLISLDGTAREPWCPSATAILVGLEKDADRSALHSRISELVKNQKEARHQILVVGAPVAESYLGTYILKDLLVLIPLAVLLMSGLLWLRYRSLAAVLLTMSQIAAAIVFVFGLLGHLGIAVTLPLTVLPVLLCGFGIADAIHLFDRYRQLGELEPALAELWRPMVKTSVTTTIGLLSFLFSPIEPIRHFGLFAALGVAFCGIWSLTVIPAGIRIFVRRRPIAAASSASFWQNLGRATWQNRLRLVVLTAGFCGLAVPALYRLEVQDSWVDGFAKSSPFRRATEEIDHLFHGTHQLLLELDLSAATFQDELLPAPAGVWPPSHFELPLPALPGIDPQQLVGETLPIAVTRAGSTTPPLRADLLGAIRAIRATPAGLRAEIDCQADRRFRRYLEDKAGAWAFEAAGDRLIDPQVLRRITATTEHIEKALGDRGAVLDLSRQLANVQFLLQGRRNEAHRPGRTSIENRQLLALLGKIRGEKRIEEIVSADHRQVLLTVFIEGAAFREVGSLLESLAAYGRQELEPAGIRLGFGGDLVSSQTLIHAVVSTQIRSLAISFGVLFLLLAAWERSLRLAFLELLPPVLAVLFNFALMGATNISLGVATSLFAAMALGIGVDFPIHLVERYRQSIKAGLEPEPAWREAVQISAPPIWVNTVVVALGFATLLVSEVPASVRLGLLGTFGVLVCCSATFSLLPYFLGRWKAPRP